MSFSSCYRYIFGLPASTLEEIVRGALAEDETASVPLELEREGIDVGGGLTADISASVVDRGDATLEVPGTGLDFILGLAMRLEVSVVELPGLEAIEYRLGLELPGAFARDASGPTPALVFGFPGLMATDLGLTIDGGDIALTPDVLQPMIDDALAAHPEVLGVKTEPRVSVPTGETVTVWSEIFHDAPDDPGFRGRITGTMPDPATLALSIPGHLRAQELGSAPMIDTDMTLTVTVAVEKDDAAGELRVRFDAVEKPDVSVAFDSIFPLYQAFAADRVAGEVAATISTFAAEIQPIPTAAELEARIAGELASFLTGFELRLEMPAPGSEGLIDLSTFEPATHNGALLLQLEPLGDGTPCDPVDPFVGATGFSLVMSEPAVRPFLDQVKAGVEGQERTIQGHQVTVTSIRVALHDPDGHDGARGHLWIEGNAEVEIDCWPDAGVDFWGPVYLSPRNEPDGLYFDADTGDFGAEDDTSCEDVDPDDIAALIDDERFPPVEGLPSDFGGIGDVTLAVTSVDIVAAGMVLHGTFGLTLLGALTAGDFRRRTFWAHEAASGP